MTAVMEYCSISGARGVWRLINACTQYARTQLQDPRILVIDEATAMFDPEGEKSFIADRHDTLARCTVIFITHRPASLALVDRVLRLEGGQMVRAICKKFVF